ncbi:DNA polymerase III subunit beta [Enterococcus columbae]|uniref:Beta sliding clamp n=1 Tax=Enterococcus columbae DSM 7374 = ATCC 51263 TaxID=1121865 RepID=S1MSX9_9ENTE|nr:DNA polymerase III subunit beta [Enterococcus columbae]EOT39160.1 DNA polymerase III, beta subunit [Enterococcus columbae DSM 7374 = ATCC 51263]EOW79907.1 DNA polymerase III, beta subunit [Enterococcus columbae DSM 7374 = ATCC 51263]OJG24529.1 DNA polymerase III, beta subunit [Enterococcus columbae DSM 7374 = ATCC 51263]
MKVTLNRSIFMQELQTVQRAIPGKSTMPILTGVKMELTPEGMYLTGSDADVSIETFLSKENEKAQMQIEQTGSIVLQARFFGEIIRRLPENEVTIEVLEANQVSITSGKANFIVNGLSASEYPQLPEVNSQSPLRLSVPLFNQLISETVFAVSQQENRPILTGVHFILENDQLLAVATDSHRLSQRIIPLESQGQQFDIVIPGKSLVELSRALSENEEFVEIAIMDNQVLFTTATMKFYSRLLEGNYPDTRRLIPTNFETSIEFSVPQFLQAVERASLLSNEGRYNIVRLSITEAGVVLYGRSPEIGKVEEKLNYEKVEGEPIEISFNPDYMRQALRAFGDTNIVIHFISAVRPFTLEPTEGNGGFIQLITPVRTN